MKRYVTVLMEEPGSRVKAYEEEFFRAPDLEFVDKKSAEVIKAHLLSRLGDDANVRLLEAAEGIGPFLSKQDVDPFVDPLVRLMIGPPTEALSRSAKRVLIGESHTTPRAIDPTIVVRLDNWIEMFEDEGQDERAARVEPVRAAFSAYLTTPSASP